MSEEQIKREPIDIVDSCDVSMQQPSQDQSCQGDYGAVKSEAILPDIPTIDSYTDDNSLRKELKMLNEKLDTVLRGQDRLAEMLAENNYLLRRNLHVTSTQRFPLVTEQDLNELEHDLNGDKRSDLIAMCEQILDKDLNNIERVFGKDLIMEFNYDGAKGKKSFKSFGHVIQALFEATAQEGRTYEDYITELRKIFRRIKNRCNKRLSRQSLLF